MQKDNLVLVYVTVPDMETGARIGREMVMKRLAACANLIPKMHSFYWWEGEVQEDQEAVLLLKTPRSRIEQLMQRVTEEHPYDVPAVVAFSVDQVYEPYLNWLIAETNDPDTTQPD